MSQDAAPAEPVTSLSAADWVSLARQSLKSADSVAAEQFGPDCDIEWLLRSRAARIEQLIVQAWQQAACSACGLHLFAVGGFGRAEMYPQSDVDLLIYLAAASDPDFAAQQAIERFTQSLWDIGLPVGLSVRNAVQTREAVADITVMTALLDSRPLVADETAIRDLRAALSDPELWTADAYFSAKLQELRQRHERFGNTSDNLEPNIKEGPGGLRDLQTLEWIAKRVVGVADLQGLIDIGHSGADEIQTLRTQHVILARLRFGLGLVAGRREERLRFDHQRELAQRLGYQGERNRPVEDMMQAFYRAAALVRRIGERLLQRFEEQLKGAAAWVPLSDARFGLNNRYLGALDSEWPRSALEILDLFIAWGEQANVKGLHSQTARALGENLQQVPAYWDADEALKHRFLQVLRLERPAKTLARMARLGVLQQFIPAFKGVSGRMQFDLFHAFTVDQHTLSVLSNLEGFARQLEDRRFSIANDVFPAVRRPELLYLAALFHDIAKGRNGDHSELGAVDAREFCLAMGYSETQAGLVEWLVRQHLLMSQTAQKQDIDDPEVIRAFALQVADRDRLDNLYLLTIADIAATSPKLWTDWKDQVLAKAYTRTRLAMRRGLENPMSDAENAHETRAEVQQLLVLRGHAAEPVQHALTQVPQTLFVRAGADQIAWIAESLLEIDGDLPLVRARRLRGESNDLEVLVHAADVEGIFSAIVISLDRLGLEIQQARVLDGNVGDIFDIFVVRPLDLRSGMDPTRLEQSLHKALQGDWTRLKPTRRRAPAHLQHFRIPTAVDIRPGQGTQAGHFLLSIICNDRVGLLADLSCCLRELGIAVHDARIATFGERAEDIFRISGPALTPATEQPDAMHSLQEALRLCIDGERTQ